MPVRYGLRREGHIQYLSEGQNTIGRKKEGIGGSFVKIGVLSVYVSREHAVILIGRNGDCWIKDCKTINGTVLAKNEGDGIQLEQNHYYQLSDGCRITFGNMEYTFFIEEKDSEAADLATNVIEKEENVLSPTTKKHIRSPVSSEKIPCDSSIDEKTKKIRRVETLECTDMKINACLSGMNPEQVDEAQGEIRRLGGTIVKTLENANLLVVYIPANRTPKLIAALALGLPVVGVEALKNLKQRENITPQYFYDNFISLHFNGVNYSSESLREASLRNKDSLPLDGVEFSLTNLPQKRKEAAKEAITYSRGSVVRIRKNYTFVLNETLLERLYHSILTGESKAKILEMGQNATD